MLLVIDFVIFLVGGNDVLVNIVVYFIFSGCFDLKLGMILKFGK